MTRKDLIKMIFPEVDTNTCAILKCSPEGCNECEYKNYWDAPASLSKTAVKSILNSTYGVNALRGTFEPILYNETDSIFKPAKQHLELIQQGWTQLPSIHNNIDWSTLNEIMSDAIVNGFEVKILNGTIYYREKQ